MPREGSPQLLPDSLNRLSSAGLPARGENGSLKTRVCGESELVSPYSHAVCLSGVQTGWSRRGGISPWPGYWVLRMGSVLISQQAAEKAIKAVYQRSGAVRVGSFSSKVSGQPAGRSLPTSLGLHAVSTATIFRTGFPGGNRQTTSPGRMQSVVRKESFNSVTVFWLDTDLVHERLRAAVERLASDQNVLRVVLFGSFAGGRAVPGSDLDIMIVLACD